MSNPYIALVEAHNALLQKTDAPLFSNLDELGHAPKAELAADAPIAMIFAPHPDDECIIGGLPLRLGREAGFKVINVAVSQGSNLKRQPERWVEVKNACDYLGWGFLPDVFHLVRPTDHGRSALYALDLSTLAAGTEVEPVMESGDFDLSSGHLVFDSPRQQIVGFRFEGVRETTVWFDDALAAVQTALDQSMPKRVNRIESWDRARERFVFLTLSERDRGGVGLFDQSGETARSEVLEPVDDENTERRSTIPVWVPLGSHQVLCYLTVPAAATPGVPQPMVLMVPDVTEQRALLKFDPMVQGLAAAGYAVLQVNFRGSEGFGTAFRKAGERSYGSAIEDDIDAALAKALRGLLTDADKHGACGGFGRLAWRGELARATGGLGQGSQHTFGGRRAHADYENAVPAATGGGSHLLRLPDLPVGH